MTSNSKKFDGFSNSTHYKPLLYPKDNTVPKIEHIVNGYPITHSDFPKGDERLQTMFLPQNSTIAIKSGYQSWKLRLIWTSRSNFEVWRKIRDSPDNKYIHLKQRLTTYRPLQVDIRHLKNPNYVTLISIFYLSYIILALAQFVSHYSMDIKNQI